MRRRRETTEERADTRDVRLAGIVRWMNSSQVGHQLLHFPRFSYTGRSRFSQVFEPFQSINQAFVKSGLLTNPL